jgi:Cu(I)/Ag(I) efflux system membrane protein CusA/SilA
MLIVLLKPPLGNDLTTTIEGRERFSVNARYAQEYRNSLESLKKLQVQTMEYGPIP